MTHKLKSFSQKMTRGVFLMSAANVALFLTLIVLLRPALDSITEGYVTNLSDYVKSDIRYTLFVGDDVNTSQYLESIAKFPLIDSIALYDANYNLLYSNAFSEWQPTITNFENTNDILSIGSIAHRIQPVYSTGGDNIEVVAGYLHIAVDSSSLIRQVNRFSYLVILILIIASVALWYLMRRFAIRESDSLRLLNESIYDISLQEAKIEPISIVPDSVEIANMQQSFNHLLTRVSVNNYELETKVKERTRDLAAAMVKNQRAEAVRRSLIMNLSHDLKTPLSSNMMYLDHVIELVEDDNLNKDTILSLLIKSRYSSMQLRDEIKTLLQFSTSSDIRNAVISNTFNVTDVVHASIVSTSEMCNVSDNTVVYAHEGREVFKSSSRLFAFVLENLITNAHSACMHGVVTINSRIDHANSLVLVIHDNGVGIPNDQKEHIFKEHFQLNDSQHAGPRGMGIGLTLVKFWVDQLGGAISVDSREGEFTRFTVKLTEDVQVDSVSLNRAQPLPSVM